MEKKRILVALSGGVDSSACTAMLRDEGYEVAGVVLRMSDAHDGAVADAQTSAGQLGIPLYVWHMEEEFDKEVAGYFARSYAEGRTPNPCVVCNPLVKFKGLMAAADAYGFQMVATGHYAGLRKDGERVLLTMGENKARDQSYMLCRLTQKELTRLIFPLSGLPKKPVFPVTTSRTVRKSALFLTATMPDISKNGWDAHSRKANMFLLKVKSAAITTGLSIIPSVSGKSWGLHSVNPSLSAGLTRSKTGFTLPGVEMSMKAKSPFPQCPKPSLVLLTLHEPVKCGAA